MKILITGNMGYVGPVVVQHLRRTMPHAFLVGLDNAWFAQSKTTNLPLPEHVLNEQRFGDVRDITAADLEGFDAIVHLAAVSNDPMGSRFEQVTDDINHQASVRLARLAVEKNIKSFVFASSCSVYGFAGDGRSRNETDEVNPLTAYARSKIATEEGLMPLANSGMVISCLRFATACGMSPRLRLDLVVNDFVACALSAKEVTVLSDGTPWRPLIHVKDMARAIEWAIGRPAENGGAFLRVNVGAEHWNHQVRDLAHAVSRAVPGTRVSINTDAPPDKRSYKVDFSLFRSLAPEHQPLEDLESTINGLRDGLEAMGFSDRDFRQSFMIRLRVLDGLIEQGLLNSDLRWQEYSSNEVQHNASIRRLYNRS